MPSIRVCKNLLELRWHAEVVRSGLLNGSVNYRSRYWLSLGSDYQTFLRQYLRPDHRDRGTFERFFADSYV